MFNRILFSSIAAAALLTAAPTFAADDAPKQPCSCCSDGSMHGVDHRLREAQKKSGHDESRSGGTREAPLFTDAG